MLRRNKLNSRGDTIIEVLIALGILAFALTTAYSIMNRSLIVARNAQEHSEALEYLSSQIEMVRGAGDNTALFNQTTPFCMAGDQIKPAGDAACKVGDEGIYVVQIVRSVNNSFGTSQQIFTFTIEWPGPGSLGNQKEQLAYKMYKAD